MALTRPNGWVQGISELHLIELLTPRRQTSTGLGGQAAENRAQHSSNLDEEIWLASSQWP